MSAVVCVMVAGGCLWVVVCDERMGRWLWLLPIWCDAPCDGVNWAIADDDDDDV